MVDAQFRNAERQHPPAVVSAEAVISTKPDIAILILNDVAHGVGSQSVVHRDVAAAVVIPCTYRQQSKQA